MSSKFLQLRLVMGITAGACCGGRTEWAGESSHLPETLDSKTARRNDGADGRFQARCYNKSSVCLPVFSVAKAAARASHVSWTKRRLNSSKAARLTRSIVYCAVPPRNGCLPSLTGAAEETAAKATEIEGKAAPKHTFSRKVVPKGLGRALKPALASSGSSAMPR